MSAYKVYGVSYLKILKRLRKSISIGKLNADEHEAKCKGCAAEAFKTESPTALSAPFDAPQFCNDFIALCDPKEFRALSIKSYQKNGKTVTKGKREGLDAYTWLPANEGAP
jgi:hypothetical protein